MAGNRAGGSDSAITDGVIKVMKDNNFLFVLFLIALNVFVTWGLIVLLRFGYSVVLGFMFVVFFPMVIQLASSFIFLFVAIPLRRMVSRHETMEMEFGDEMGRMDGVSACLFSLSVFCRVLICVAFCC
jgi:hypothetical protein